MPQWDWNRKLCDHHHDDVSIDVHSFISGTVLQECIYLTFKQQFNELEQKLCNKIKSKHAMTIAIKYKVTIKCSKSKQDYIREDPGLKHKCILEVDGLGLALELAIVCNGTDIEFYLSARVFLHRMGWFRLGLNHLQEIQCMGLLQEDE